MIEEHVHDLKIKELPPHACSLLRGEKTEMPSKMPRHTFDMMEYKEEKK